MNLVTKKEGSGKRQIFVKTPQVLFNRSYVQSICKKTGTRALGIMYESTPIPETGIHSLLTNSLTMIRVKKTIMNSQSKNTLIGMHITIDLTYLI